MSPSASTGTDNRQMAEQIYDMLMGDIEPDLLLANIPGLDEKYKGETDAEHKARARFVHALKDGRVAFALGGQLSDPVDIFEPHDRASAASFASSRSVFFSVLKAPRGRLCLPE